MLEGTLSKWTNVMKGWQYRYFVLDENAGLLSYYTSKEKMMKGVRRGCVRLKGAIIGIDDQDVNTFTITVDHKTFHFQARDSDEREKWVRRLEDTILRHANRLKNFWEPSYPSLQSTSSFRRPNPLITFDKKVSEADVYLQLLIEQASKIEHRISDIPEPDTKSKSFEIQCQANAMLENIKHSIVLLQIAKNTAHPINGIYQGPVADVTKDLSDPSDSNLMTLLVPETSYSSSEGEDDFYDANEDPFAANSISGVSPLASNRPFDVTPNATNEPTTSCLQSAEFSAGQPTNKPAETVSKKTIPVRTDGSLDYDALYEDEDETNLSMESHGNVVTHLLSQVKIGMDLTKVVLPTFILERRSLLEMYADYFAHPDLFLKIVDFKDPKDRLIQVVRWYLSSYHAGRKSTVAKKPYNPILGEIFQCHWDVNEAGDVIDESVSNDGPVPWCRRDQLTFIAEQVSHHPPISAFYAEHYAKKISFCAHVWTKSKFLGLSIGVHNIGQGIVTLCDLNEEYIVTFPNGYGRSILTVPWIELGGSVTINCPQTGFHCDIEFITKPFYGGKRNKINAELYAPNEKKSFMTIAGEWSGLMEVKNSDGQKPKAEVFVDVNSIPIYKKKVRPIVEQVEYESRKVWKEVTAGLRLNDIDRATTAKSQVEGKQREEAKQRKEENGDWDTKYFKPIGESWIYTKPLSQRLYQQDRDAKR